MKKCVTFCLCLALMSCSVKKKPEDLSVQLKSAMSDYLNTDPKVKGKVAYEVKSVIYFEDASSYLCEFKVHMTNLPSAQNTPKIDTIGDMKVKFDKKFKVIGRFY